MTISERPWWKDAIIYQIYPASFQDSNNDGIGDLPGITGRLDYIKSIGVNTIWICPMYERYASAIPSRTRKTLCNC